MGVLFYIMGASGSGKDTLLDAALAQLDQSDTGRALLPRRVERFITRDAAAGGEAHHAVSNDDFSRMLDAGKFCMHWEAHGLSYGIPAEISSWLASGHNVLVNGSRAYLPEARQVFPDLVAVLIEISAETQKSRLEARKRESSDAIEKRLSRKVSLDTNSEGLVVIDNEQALQESVDQLCALIAHSTQAAQ